MELRCIKCGREFPSIYWLRAEGICIECYPKLTAEELVGVELLPPTSPEPLLPFPSVLQAVVLLPTLLACLTLPVGLFLNSAGAFWPPGIRFMLLYLGTWGLLTAFVVTVAASRGRLKEPMLKKVFPPIGLFAQLLTMGVLMLLGSGGLIVVLFRPPAGNFQLAPSDVFGALTRVAIAPAVEETLFRGIVLYSFLKRMTAWKAIATSSIIFAVLHVSPERILIAFPAGILLGWIYFRYQSIGPTIAVHAFVNALGFLVGVFALNLEATKSATPTGIEAAAIVIGSVSTFVILGFWLKLLEKKVVSSPTAPT